MNEREELANKLATYGFEESASGIGIFRYTRMRVPGAIYISYKRKEFAYKGYGPFDSKFLPFESLEEFMQERKIGAINNKSDLVSMEYTLKQVICIKG